MKNLLKLAFVVQTYRKCSQVNASQPKSSQVGGQTRQESAQVNTWDDLRPRLIRP